jgi:hypothetical protein
MHYRFKNKAYLEGFDDFEHGKKIEDCRHGIIAQLKNLTGRWKGGCHEI